MRWRIDIFLKQTWAVNLTLQVIRLCDYLSRYSRVMTRFRNVISKQIYNYPITCGANTSNEIYYVIHRNDSNVGLFSNVIVFLEHINYAVERGYTPIIDMKYYPNAYIYESERGHINSWEYYFEQPATSSEPSGVSLDHIYKCSKIIITNGKPLGHTNFFDPKFMHDTQQILKWRNIYSQYIRINSRCRSLIELEYSKISQQGERILGVFCRGTDYLILKPQGHPIQPELSTILRDTATKINEWNCDKIFLSTEDVRIHNLFKERFGDLIISNQRKYVSTLGSKKYVTQISYNRKNDKYLQGLEYLTSLVILSRCNCIIGSSTSGMVGVLLMSKGFEHELLYDYGVYDGTHDPSNDAAKSETSVVL